MNFIHRISMLGGLLGIVSLVWDRVSFYLYKKRYYKSIFLNYGENIRWGKHSLRLTIPKSIRIANPHKISIGNDCEFDEYVYLQSHHEEGLFIGNGVRINAFTHIQAFSKVTIGDFVLVAPFSHINSGNHGIADHHSPIMHQGYHKSGIIKIGTGSWMGRNSHILGNVILGKNCVVAANAVVTKSFPDFSIVGGIPAKLLKENNEKRN